MADIRCLVAHFKHLAEIEPHRSFLAGVATAAKIGFSGKGYLLKYRSRDSACLAEKIAVRSSTDCLPHKGKSYLTVNMNSVPLLQIP